MGSIFGSIIGLLPATLAGFLIASFKLYHNVRGLLWSAIIGAGTTVIFASTIVHDDIFALISIVLVGATSAVLTALFALPKLQK